MERNLKRTVILSSAVLGTTAIVSQIVILRELLVIFYGNELSIGLMLASWLIWVAAGSWILGRFTERLVRKPLSIVAVQASAAVLIPVLVFLSRTIKNIFPFSPGEIVGIAPMLLSASMVLAPLCLILGFTFSLLCASYPKGTASAERIGLVYILEAVGSTFGGLVFSLILIRFLTPTQTGFLLGGLNLIAGLLSAHTIRVRLIPATLLTAYIIALALGATGKLEELAISKRWKGLELVFNDNSIYGNVAVISLGEEKTFYENGLLAFSTGQRRSAEETAHIPLLAHSDPEDVLLLGGGVSGVLSEILKHPIESATYVELDPMIVDAARKLSLKRANEAIRDRRVEVVYDDGRRFIKLSKARYDVIISNLPDPLTALVNRFYSVEYFKEVKRAMRPHGVLSVGVTSSENFLNPEQQKFLASIYQTLNCCFDYVLLVPGDYTYFLASDDPQLETVTYQTLLDRIAKLGITTGFITDGYLPYRMDPGRILFFLSSIKQAEKFAINTDLRPAGYFYCTVTWLTRFRSRSASLLSRISSLRPLWHVLPFGLLFLALIYPTLSRREPKSPIVAAVFTTGYSEMVFQVVVIFCFQAFFGYLYFRLGVILTSFMIGLALGALIINRRLSALADPRNLFMKIQMGMCVYPVFLAIFLLWVSRVSQVHAVPYKGQLAFAFLPIIAGFLGGVQFPLAARILFAESGGTGKVAGYLYGVDLLGSCLGAVLASTILIPILGIVGTCMLAFVASVTALLLILLSRVRQKLWH